MTMTCRCEALDMLDNYNESVEKSFNDQDVSLNTSSDKSSEMETSQTSAGGSSSEGNSEGNQFGSPAAVGVPQVSSTTSCSPQMQIFFLHSIEIGGNNWVDAPWVV